MFTGIISDLGKVENIKNGVLKFVSKSVVSESPVPTDKMHSRLKKPSNAFIK
jgi:riboflavin synthase alpha subunit